jgi:DNA-binding NarL/FixJ family response regulator
VRLLIVDDNPDFLVNARILLEREGETVVGVASNGADALRLVEETRPDVALVDIHLGAESGFDIARALRGAGQPHIVLLSAYAESDFGELVTSSAASGFVSKSNLSAAAIAEVLARRGDEETPPNAS